MNELGNTPADKDYNPSGISKAAELWIAGVFLAYSVPDTSVKELREIAEKSFIAGYQQAEKDLAPLIEAATIVYEAWNGGTIDDVRREMVELGKQFKEAKQ